MGRGFEKLRLAVSAGVMGVLAGVCGATRTARAAIQALPFSVTTGGARWRIVNNTTVVGGNAFGSGAGNGLGIQDATLLSPVRTDALDGSTCVINGTVFQDPTGLVDLSSVANGKLLTSNVATIGTVQAQMTLLFSNTAPIVRWICTVTNTSGSPQAVTLQRGFNLGSDSDTTLVSTSSGDAALDPADHWLVTSDGAVNSDPVLLWGRFGAGGTVAPTNITAPGPGNGFLVDRYTLNLAAGETASIMMLLRLNQSTTEATAGSFTFTSLGTIGSAGLLSDLTPTQISEIANYGGATTVAVPALSDIARLVLVVLVGGSGYALAARRRREGEAA